MSWEVHLVNGYSRRLQVAVGFKQDSCSEYGRPWGTRGWWLLDPGASAHVLNTDNRYFYYYAEAVDGRLWTSEGPFFPVTQRRFDSCIDIGSTDARNVGMRQRDLTVTTWWRLT
jgi:uncharacterized membrane protein